jgi:SAM-dependent methyltransferase
LYYSGGSKILNFGCGYNTYTDKLTKEYNHDVFPVDIVDISIGNNPFYVYDGINIPLHSSGTKYDIAIVSTVIHHIPKDQQLKILNQIKKVSDKIIILEDYIDGSIYSFLKTCAICSFFNASVFDHPFAFRTNQEWLKLFNKLNPKDIFYKHDIYELYILSF